MQYVHQLLHAKAACTHIYLLHLDSTCRIFTCISEFYSVTAVFQYAATLCSPIFAYYQLCFLYNKSTVGPSVAYITHHAAVSLQL